MRKHWPFILAVVLQVLIVAAVPATRLPVLLSGRTVLLKTAPVDPYDILSGYHVVLSYEISAPDRLDRLPGTPYFQRGDRACVVLKEGPDGVWGAVRASGEWPKDVKPDEVVIKGRYDGRRIVYGIEHYFIPEGKGAEIEQGLRTERARTRVEVKVDGFGHAALVRLHVGDKTYDY